MSRKTTDTRERIIGTAKKLFILNGYKGTSTKQIAAETGVSEMTLFRYFPTKESVFTEVIRPVVSFLSALEIGEVQDLNTLAKRMLHDRLNFLCEERDLVRLVLMESYHSSFSSNPIAETAEKIRGVFSTIDKENGDLYLRLIMGFILTCIFLPQTCDGFHEDLDRLIALIE